MERVADPGTLGGDDLGAGGAIGDPAAQGFGDIDLGAEIGDGGVEPIEHGLLTDEGDRDGDGSQDYAKGGGSDEERAAWSGAVPTVERDEAGRLTGGLEAGGGEAGGGEGVDGRLDGGFGNQDEAELELAAGAIAVGDAPGPEDGVGGEWGEAVHFPAQGGVEVAFGGEGESDGLFEQKGWREGEADGAVAAFDYYGVGRWRRGAKSGPRRLDRSGRDG